MDNQTDFKQMDFNHAHQAQNLKLYDISMLNLANRCLMLEILGSANYCN